MLITHPQGHASLCSLRTICSLELEYVSSSHQRLGMPLGLRELCQPVGVLQPLPEGSMVCNLLGNLQILLEGSLLHPM